MEIQHKWHSELHSCNFAHLKALSVPVEALWNHSRAIVRARAVWADVFLRTLEGASLKPLKSDSLPRLLPRSRAPVMEPAMAVSAELMF